MVMSKVSKTVIASFLCLLFNAGGNVTNAMDNKDLIINNNDLESNMKEYENYINNNISNNAFPNNLFSSNFELKTNKMRTVWILILIIIYFLVISLVIRANANLKLMK